ncbi:MAG: hypothetical protein ABSF26_27775 [Thermoguttaceae bacterium]|jgi:hypothetical protein
MGTAPAVAPSPGPDPAAAALPLPAYDGWELDEELKHLGRLLGRTMDHDAAEQAASGPQRMRVDAAGRVPPPWHRRKGRLKRQARSTPGILRAAGRRRGSVPLGVSGPQPARGSRLLAAITWIALSLGTMAFACGGALLAWSIIADRPELRPLATPVALAGQIAAVIGLILQLDRLWRDNRNAAGRLEAVDQQLHELKTSAALGKRLDSPAAAAHQRRRLTTRPRRSPGQRP